MAIGTPEQVAAAIKALAEVDDRTLSAPSVELQVIDLKNTDAGAMAKTVESMLAQRSRWPERSRRRSALAWASPRRR